MELNTHGVATELTKWKKYIIFPSGDNQTLNCSVQTILLRHEGEEKKKYVPTYMTQNFAVRGKGSVLTLGHFAPPCYICITLKKLK